MSDITPPMPGTVRISDGAVATECWSISPPSIPEGEREQWAQAQVDVVTGWFEWALPPMVREGPWLPETGKTWGWYGIRWTKK